jgi:hypothetical protein
MVTLLTKVPTGRSLDMPSDAHMHCDCLRMSPLNRQSP